MTYAAVFDLDGTLVDTPRAIVEAFTAAFVALNLQAEEATAIRATIGLPLELAFSRLMSVSLDDELVARGVEQYQVAFKELVLPRARSLVFAGVDEGLATLRAQDFALAVATSKFHASAEALLTAAGLREHFHVVVGADQVARPKPDPEMGRLVMRKLNVEAERTVMVGDTTHDMTMATAAGMRSVAVTYGIHSEHELRSSAPTWMADTFGDAVQCIRASRDTVGGRR